MTKHCDRYDMLTGGGAANSTLAKLRNVAQRIDEPGVAYDELDNPSRLPGSGPSPDVVHQPGGDVLLQAKHPVYTTFERLYRRAPKEGMYDPSISRARPFQFELGSFTVPKSQQLWLFDYSFTVYRPSGIDPGDFQEAEDGRFSNQMGFDLTIGDNQRPGDIEYQLDPQPITTDRTAFSSSNPTAGTFARARANAFAAVAGVGTSLLPVRRDLQGPRNAPFMYQVVEGRTIALTCVIFSRLIAPISAIQGRIAGYRLSSSLANVLLDEMRPR